jgi:hypothetical protein
MGWQRLGRVYIPSGEKLWLASHASVPFAEPMQDGLVRIWFSPRDAANHSHIAWLVIEMARPDRVLAIANEPVLGCGPPGAFDDCGAMMSWLAGERLYFIGWTTRATVPFHVSIGLAERAGGNWRRSPAPLLDRGPEDPWFCSNPSVLNDGTRQRMWYLGGLGWEQIGGRWSPSYHICHAHSTDGLHWQDRGTVAVPLEGDEFALARPSVLRTSEGWLMWFCARTRSRPYRLRAARSFDGLHWDRAPDLGGLEPAETGWDREMIAYPHVFEHIGARWMLYCGNGFGRSGFGLAVWN